MCLLSILSSVSLNSWISFASNTRLGWRKKWVNLTHFQPMLHFHNPWKHGNTYVSLFLGGIEVEHSLKMGWNMYERFINTFFPANSKKSRETINALCKENLKHTSIMPYYFFISVIYWCRYSANRVLQKNRPSNQSKVKGEGVTVIITIIFINR